MIDMCFVGNASVIKWRRRRGGEWGKIHFSKIWRVTGTVPHTVEKLTETDRPTKSDFPLAHESAPQPSAYAYVVCSCLL